MNQLYPRSHEWGHGTGMSPSSVSGPQNALYAPGLAIGHYTGLACSSTCPTLCTLVLSSLNPENSGVIATAHSGHNHVGMSAKSMLSRSDPSASVLEMSTSTPCVPVGNSYRWKHEAVCFSCPAHTSLPGSPAI